MAFSFLGIDHVRVASPIGCEEAARLFYGKVLGWPEIEKPEPLKAFYGNRTGKMIGWTGFSPKRKWRDGWRCHMTRKFTGGACNGTGNWKKRPGIRTPFFCSSL